MNYKGEPVFHSLLPDRVMEICYVYATYIAKVEAKPRLFNMIKPGGSVIFISKY